MGDSAEDDRVTPSFSHPTITVALSARTRAGSRLLGLEAEDGGDVSVAEGVGHLFDQRSHLFDQFIHLFDQRSIYSTKATASCLLRLEAEDGGDGRVAEGVGHDGRERKVDRDPHGRRGLPPPSEFSQQARHVGH